MKNKTIKKLTKGIVAIALTIATVVGAGVIGAQEYNAYTTDSTTDISGRTQVNELCAASVNYKYSPTWRSMAEWCNTCYMGGKIAQETLEQERCANPYATGEDGVAQFLLADGSVYTGDNKYKGQEFVEQVILDNGLCTSYVDQFKALNRIHQNYQLPAKYAKTAATATTTMIDNFDATFYANMYPDVKKAIGTDATKLYNHYVTYGKAEGRYANQAAYNAAHKSK